MNLRCHTAPFCPAERRASMIPPLRCCGLMVLLRAGGSLLAGMAIPAPTLHAEETGATLLDPVVVTATRSAQRAFDLPVAIDTVTKEPFQL
jgi:outer membrane receptor protein involved in Fe transport